MDFLPHLLAGTGVATHVGQPTITVAHPLMGELWSAALPLAFEGGLLAYRRQPFILSPNVQQGQPSFSAETVS
ncbi:hypothetical protein [Bradyrhizobium sp. AZCC 2289]|uniref:hypothetical protein n=1 Tax=Bradyrhizobium sp. AZCC 2289 TaxID=3117026 RepID=UPI002FF32107